MAVLLYYEAFMGKDKTSKEIQEKLDRLNRNIDECEKTRKKMERVIERYDDALEEVGLLKQTYESLIATHNDLINQFMEKIKK